MNKSQIWPQIAESSIESDAVSLHQWDWSTFKANDCDEKTYRAESLNMTEGVILTQHCGVCSLLLILFNRFSRAYRNTRKIRNDKCELPNIQLQRQVRLLMMIHFLPLEWTAIIYFSEGLHNFPPFIFPQHLLDSVFF